MARARGSRLSGLHLIPRAIAGQPREHAAAAGCALTIGVIFAVEALTPDAVVSSLVLVPLLAACWLLSDRWAFDLWLLSAVMFAVAIALEPSNRITLTLVAVPTLFMTWLARASAGQVTTVLRVRTGLSNTRLNGDTGTLTRREREVAHLAAMAYTASEIGSRLHIGERTVETHLARTYSKLGITSKSELIRLLSTTDSL